MKKAVILFIVLSLILLPGLGGCSKDDREPLVIYNWGEYISREQDTYTLYDREYPIEDVIRAFESAYPQYKVTYLTYDDNEKMYPKLDKESYDIIVPSDYMVVRLIKEDKLQLIDMDKLPNVIRYLDPRLQTIQLDPDAAVNDLVSDYAVPYLYCTVGLMYNATELEAITGNTNYYPDAATVDTLEVYYSNETIDALYDQIWQTVLAN